MAHSHNPSIFLAYIHCKFKNFNPDPSDLPLLLASGARPDYTMN